MIATRKDIIKHMIPLVSSQGWCEQAMQEAAKQAGATADDLKLLFPEGVRDCIVIFLSEEDRALTEMVPSETLFRLSLPEKMEKIIMARLNAWLPERDIIRSIVSFNSLPWNNIWALKTVFNSVDRMWRIAGDVSSTSVSLYKKRMTLAGVYNATLSFWLDDTSPNLEATTIFLRRQLYAEVAAFGYFHSRDQAPGKSRPKILNFKTKA